MAGLSDWGRKILEGRRYATLATQDAERRQHFFDSLVSETSLQEHLMQQAEKIGENTFPGTLKQLRATAAADLLKTTAAPRTSIGPANGIIVDGWIFPKPPAQVFAEGQQQRVSLLIGNNSRERTPPQRDGFLAFLRERCRPVVRIGEVTIFQLL